jgi:EAL domain-containing protein (putative c-di-GMP-specific phosphodiesterase class I)
LSYLQVLPFDTIKIDQTFVSNIGAQNPSSNICTTIIKMAHELEKTVIAEGVETQQQFQFLKDNACEIVQGYLYSKPITLEELKDLIRKLSFHTQRRRALKIIS